MKGVESGGSAEVLMLEWEEDGGVDESRRNLAALTAVLREQRPFGMIFTFPHNKAPSKEAQRLRQAWLKENREEIARHCFGLAVVSSAAFIAALLRPVVLATGRARFGCACDFFTSRESADHWLRQQHRGTLLAR